MNRNSRNHKKTDDQNVHGLRKVSFWEKYGARRFPYRGRRRYSTFVYRSEDGGIVISNDVFGLTIRQFECTYNTCLDRRKAHEQYILNIRYPDKTSDKYMEYLENRRYNNTDDLSWSRSDFKVKFLFEHLVHTAGSEIDMRKSKLFIIQDMMSNIDLLQVTKISSGSLAEGIDLPGSDIDIMIVIRDVDVVRDVRSITHPVKRTTLLMETDNDYLGFSRLRLIAGGDWENSFIRSYCFESTRTGLYLSVNKFVSNINKMMPSQMFSPHGPCLSDKMQKYDFAFCLRSKCLAYNTTLWASRYRQQWPPNSTINKIKKYGCLLVPMGPKTMSDYGILWRLSFSVAEKQLVHSLNFTQLLCYCLLKLTLKHIINTNKHAEGLLCSYFLKTALFWVSEEVNIDTFKISKLFVCFYYCLDKLKFWVQKCFCPNYFIPEHNMFLGKITSDNNTILLNILDGIKGDGIDELTKCLFSNDNGSCSLLRTHSESFSIQLDFLVYMICSVLPMTDISQCLKVLTNIEFLIKSNSSTFIIDVCKYHHAKISQYAAQLLPPQTIMTETYNIRKRYHRHLQDGIKTDAVSGWLLYASFYYVTGQFNVTLRITDYVLSRCSSDLIAIPCGNPNEDMNNYRKYVHSTMTLNDKMRIATENVVAYLKHSTLIPRELEPVNDVYLFITPTVMSHCLKCLCYHHLGDLSNRKQALYDLCLSVYDTNLVSSTTVSTSLTILGVCYEISGDKDTAYQCYDDALQCDDHVCLSAETRKSKLLQM